MGSETANLKKALRRDLRARLRSIAPTDASAWSDAICAHIMSLCDPACRVQEHGLAKTTKPWHPMDDTACKAVPPGTVLGFFPMAGEPDIRPALRDAMRSGKRVCLPRTDWQTGSMEAVPVQSLDALTEVRAGLFEPCSGAATLDPGQIGLVLVPGLGFGGDGARLGRGKGFYDRYLARTPARTVGVGVGFEVQRAGGIPMESGDRRIDGLVTERGVHWYRAPGPRAGE